MGKLEEDAVAKRIRHAEAQDKYANKKSSDHTRMCVWVPDGKQGEFREATSKLKSKWSKD